MTEGHLRATQLPPSPPPPRCRGRRGPAATAATVRRRPAGRPRGPYRPVSPAGAETRCRPGRARAEAALAAGRRRGDTHTTDTGEVPAGRPGHGPVEAAGAALRPAPAHLLRAAARPPPPRQRCGPGPEVSARRRRLSGGRGLLLAWRARSRRQRQAGGKEGNGRCREAAALRGRRGEPRRWMSGRGWVSAPSPRSCPSPPVSACRQPPPPPRPASSAPPQRSPRRDPRPPGAPRLGLGAAPGPGGRPVFPVRCRGGTCERWGPGLGPRWRVGGGAGVSAAPARLVPASPCRCGPPGGGGEGAACSKRLVG